MVTKLAVCAVVTNDEVTEFWDHDEVPKRDPVMPPSDILRLPESANEPETRRLLDISRLSMLPLSK